MKHIILVLVILCGIYRIHAQEFTRDYLDGLGDEALLSLFDVHDGDSITLEKIARAYLDRAKLEKDTIKMARGYDRLARIFHPQKNIVYADSIIELTREISHITYPGLAYIIKSIAYNDLGNLKMSTENILLAYEKSIKSKNLSHELYSLHILITFKTIWGDKEEALVLQQRRDSLISDSDFRKKLSLTMRDPSNVVLDQLVQENKINSLFLFVLCLSNLKQFDKSIYYLDELKSKLKVYKGLNRVAYNQLVLETELELDYHSQNYSLVITKAQAALKNNISNMDQMSLFDIYSFLGYSYIDTNREKLGITALIKADSIHEVSNLRLLPYRRKVFAELLDYYTLKKDRTNQIRYLTKLLKVDSIFKYNFEYFNSEIYKRFETPILLKKKEEMINNLELENSKSRIKNWFAITFLILSIALLTYYFIMQRKYRSRFETLVAFTKRNDVEEIIRKQNVDISSEKVEEILEKLNTFEIQKEFLNPDINLQDLAKKMKTNANYLSRVINLKREKNFAQYLHDLRIAYATQEISSNPNFRKYTVKAIATECGYSNADSFSRAFYKKHGIYPSYYIKKLNSNNS